jgi:sulfhydrogenase subunit beta (sulfur reductase)
MIEAGLQNNSRSLIQAEDFPKLIEILSQKGYRIIGSTESDNAIIYDEISSVEELPIGIIDVQDGGRYRLKKSQAPTYFAYVNGPQSCKKYLYPPIQELWEAEKTKTGFKLAEKEEPYPRTAFLGVRSCELEAIKIQDKIFTEGPYADKGYKMRRDNSIIVAVNCTRASGTCFCVSMGTGPKVKSGYDLALTEVLDGEKHYFVIEPGSDLGASIIKEMLCVAASEEELRAAESAINSAAKSMGRKLETSGLKEIIAGDFDSPHWHAVAARCLSCGNCTMVCPTCFCTTIEDTSDLTGEKASHIRKWDSCFTLDFSYIYGGSIRQSPMSRYRQWMTHKLSTWVDQFGMMGCVGCGRCITWCPVGIDITEEARIMREGELLKEASIYNKEIKDGNA